MSIEDSLKLVEANWDNIGACGSCGWHDIFANYDYLIKEDLEEGVTGIELLCHSDDVDVWSHRGVRFNIKDLAASQEDKETAS